MFSEGFKYSVFAQPMQCFSLVLWGSLWFLASVEAFSQFSQQQYQLGCGAPLRPLSALPPPPPATPTTLINQRRWALATLGTGLGVGFVKDAIAEGAWNVVKEREQPRVRNFRLPLAVGLGTCCPCDVLGEGDYEDVGGEGDYEDVGVCTPTFGQVSEGIDAGYRFIDTASHYKNERSVGLAVVNAVKSGVVSREDLLVCTKVWIDDLGYEKTQTSQKIRAVLASNERLLSERGGGADIVLIHFPGSIDSVQSPAKNKKLRQESWKALEKLKLEGTVKAIGVSNYVRRHMKELLSSCSVPPDVVQMEIHPLNQQAELVQLCREKGIQVVGFSPLAHGDLPILKNKVLLDIAAGHSKSAAQVVMRWMLQEGIVPIVQTSLPRHLAENLDTDDFSLSDEDMTRIRSLDAGKRVGFDPNLIA